MAKATTETELSGIRMAERRGVRRPAAAKEIPSRLYRKERIKPAVTMCMAVLLNLMKAGNFRKFRASRIPSHAGEK